MSNRFILPCPECQAPLSVGLTQAGETVTCSCGAQVLVPALRELKLLPSASPTHSSAGQRAWSTQRGLAFVCGVLMIAAAAMLYWRISPQRAAINIEKPAFRELTIDLDTLKPLDAWAAWVHFRDQTLDYRNTPKYIENRVVHAELSYYLYAAVAAGVLGLSLVVGSVLWPGSQRGST
ncbi:MAG: hypothetical protein KDA92_15025 [Planctomycetales bacterium]|nr:hypothetical protein [Planctomycetales bacterium]